MVKRFYFAILTTFANPVIIFPVGISPVSSFNFLFFERSNDIMDKAVKRFSIFFTYISKNTFTIEAETAKIELYNQIKSDRRIHT